MRKGSKASEETRDKMSRTHTGMRHSQETKFKMSQSLMGNKYSFGRKVSEETRKKLRETHKGMLGKKHSETTLEIMRKKRGKFTSNWRGGISTVNQIIRGSREYKLWREAVFTRDNWICVWCGVRGGNLHADHIKSFAQHPELRFAIDNGRTLCFPCHKTTGNYCGKGEKRVSKVDAYSKLLVE